MAFVLFVLALQVKVSQKLCRVCDADAGQRAQKAPRQGARGACSVSRAFVMSKSIDMEIGAQPARVLLPTQGEAKRAQRTLVWGQVFALRPLTSPDCTRGLWADRGLESITLRISLCL